MNLQENISRIKKVMGIVNEQVSTDLKSYLDELLKDPVAFVNKLKTDEQFKNAYVSSYKNPKTDFTLLELAKMEHLMKSGPLTGRIRNMETNQIVREVTINNMDEYNQALQSLIPGGVEKLLLSIPKLYPTPNGDEVAYALNVPEQILRKDPNYNWFK
jgi:hypothetical protein